MRDESAQLAVMRSINRYLTPFAAVLVALGATASGFDSSGLIALALVAFSVVINLVLMRYLGRSPDRQVVLRHGRLGFNYLFNIAIVYLLWPHWRPGWLLFLLSICGVAAFEDRQTTTATAGMFSLMLFVIHYQRGSHVPSAFLEILAYAGALWTAGVLINVNASASAASRAK